MRDHQAVAASAVQLYANPLASVPDFAKLMVGETTDRARLAALAGETALAAGRREWLKESATSMADLAAELPPGTQYDTLRTRLRILAAEGSSKWAEVLGDARALKLGYELGALVQARYARHLALLEEFEEADAYVIALAQARGGLVVTAETSASQKSKPKRPHYIPDVCRDLGIPCINMLGLMRREGWTF